MLDDLTVVQPFCWEQQPFDDIGRSDAKNSKNIVKF